MKRCWIGGAFLLAVLVCSLATTWAMEKIHAPIESDLDRAAASALLGDWENADRFFSQAQDAWEKWDHLRGCFADHTPIEEIGAGLKSAEVYGKAREQTDFAARCRELARKTAAVGEAHGVGWWNVF